MEIKYNLIKCGSGWSKLYQPIIDEIIDFDITKSNYSEKIGIESIESNDGLLKIKVINAYNLTDEISKHISDAEFKSSRVCEFCGADTDVGTTMNSEYKTCCKKCWENVIRPRENKSIWKSYETNKIYK